MGENLKGMLAANRIGWVEYEIDVFVFGLIFSIHSWLILFLEGKEISEGRFLFVLLSINCGDYELSILFRKRFEGKISL